MNINTYNSQYRNPITLEKYDTSTKGKLARLHYDSTNDLDLRVGCLETDGKFYCFDCVDNRKIACDVYLRNILPYHQHCSRCGLTIVVGSNGWPNLFE